MIKRQEWRAVFIVCWLLLLVTLFSCIDNIRFTCSEHLQKCLIEERSPIFHMFNISQEVPIDKMHAVVGINPPLHETEGNYISFVFLVLWQVFC